ncbi:GHKL domain-containing protein [Lachnospiraceae bacterium WCA-9-b2]|jgi:sensor histidine kinase YesM|uniref:GHKL domain-containing protein n=1 Tax=Sporofaciens musculi TaxID=2681861 RepID=A0A7X3ML95_9FIRM|nr:sensor histidine kinase [Sporofaciens musculi]MXP78434.1 GHKL domain-containing protein [Sporofaciens musculi]
MSQPAFEIVNSILDIWKIAVQAIMFLVLWTAAFREKKSKRDGVAAVLFILANIGIGFLPCTAWVRYGVSALAIMGYGGIRYKKQIGKAVFVMLAFYNLHCLGYLMASSIYEKVMSVMMKSIDFLQDSYLQEVNQCMAVGVFCLTFSYSVLLATMTLILYRLMKDVTIMAWQDVILLSILNFVGSMITKIIVGLLTVKIDDELFILFDEKPNLLWKMPLVAVLIFAGEAALIYFWQRYRILLAERQKHFIEEQQVKAMKKRLEEAENFYGSIRKVRHEMKNHMANIKGLAGAGEYGEIEDYVRRMDETMQELEYRYVTGNAVTDVIINDKCRRAEKAGIRFDADFRYGGEIPVFDMGIILNNLLDNAIEACEKLETGKGFVRLSLKRKKQFLILYVENSFDGAVPISKGSPLPPTTKQSILPGIITEHGIGLENVRDIAERYFGGVNIKVKGDVFHVTVMLQQENQDKIV